MSSSPPKKKEKRRIVPMHIVDPEERKENTPEPVKKKGHDMRPSVYHDEFLKYANSKEYEKELRERAVKLGYEKPQKESKRKENPKREERKEDARKHARLDSKGAYIVAYLKARSHSKGNSIYDMLMKQFDGGKYYSPATKRFRKYN
jgi:hypothetical protein